MLHLLLFLSSFSLFSQLCYCKTVLVDGVSDWKNPNVHVGDSIIFRHKYHYNLYIFRSERAFDLCNFAQSSLLTKSNSTSYTWNPSRTGFFYFAFNNGSSNNSCNQKYSQKLPIRVSPAAEPPVTAPFPAPNSGGGRAASSPAGFPWPFPPRETAASAPAPEPSSGGVASSPMTVPTMVPGDKSNGIPFINSNPAVPLPTGEVDSATIRPFSPSSSGHHQQVAVGLLGGALLTLFTVVLLLL
ncbi:uncharacterized protein LOC126670960 [Mercurialis annua]|uniref:uncharacterized protein LOC126670960 n=1 Tax=Mercurialis annua TaxID=3986 RepID=UPI0021608B6C|nr:uncharacterized protein LOC126670960 [Mercurialis annua]